MVTTKQAIDTSFEYLTTDTVDSIQSISSDAEEQDILGITGVVVGAVIGGVITILLAFIAISLLALVLRWKRNNQSFRATTTNPICDGK